MTTGIGIHDDDENSAASRNAKSDKKDGDEGRKDTPDVDESAGEPTA